jgi:hypothetical protein
VTQGSHHAALVAYLKEKVEASDWHGVSDAANDLRVLEAQIEHQSAVLRGLRTRPDHCDFNRVEPFAGVSCISQCIRVKGHEGHHIMGTPVPMERFQICTRCGYRRTVWNVCPRLRHLRLDCARAI